MKVNLVYGPESQVQTGFLNLSPMVEEENDIVKMCDIRNLDQYVCDAEVMELVAHGVIDYIPLPEVTNVIDHWIKKLRIGGKITVSGVDAYSVAKSFTEYRIDIDTFNQLLLGQQGYPHEHKSNVLTMASLTKYLEQVHGLQIINKRYDNYMYIVNAERTE